MNHCLETCVVLVITCTENTTQFVRSTHVTWSSIRNYPYLVQKGTIGVKFYSEKAQ